MTAARTDPVAAHHLAGLYRGGEEGLLQSPELEFRWELLAAEHGHVEAQYTTGCMYNNGEGVRVDHAAAATWFEKAAEQGDQRAQFNLGCFFEHGTGTPQNSELAATWYQRAADQGDADAMASLGHLCDTGRGVEQDHVRANTLYREAIEVDGNPFSLHNLGYNYSEGAGVERSLATAVSYWQRAADRGHAGSRHNIGKAFIDGDGGYDKNIQLARQYIKASAAQGDDEAVARLKRWNACAHCGTTAAPKVCSGCIMTRYRRYCDD